MASQPSHCSEPSIEALPCYHELVERWVALGSEGKFAQRGSEFKGRKSAAAIVEKTPTGLDHMIEEGRVAAIKVGVTMWIHIPTTSALIQRRERWDWNACPRCPKTS